MKSSTSSAAIVAILATLAYAPAPVLASAPAGAMLSFQGDKKGADKKTPPKDDPKVVDLLKQLKKVWRGRADSDSEGARLLDELARLFEGLNTKQQKAVAKGAGDSFKARRKPDEVVLYLSAGEALSGFGDLGASELAKVVQDRRFKKKDWSVMRSQMVRLLGRPADTRYVNLLLDIALKDNDDQARGKAGEALGYYAKYDQKIRKKIFEKLVKGLEEVYAQSKANIDPNDLGRETWVQRYAAIQDPWMKTLTRLSGQSIKDVQAWTHWWNKNKRDNWDKKGFKGAIPKGT